jgi:predicted transcriptional regulator
MATLIEMAAEIVSSHASSSPMSTDELLNAIQRVYATLKQVESGEPAEVPTAEEQKPAVSAKQSIKKNEVICLICGKGGMKTLTRHLTQAHQMKPGAYRKQFGIPRTLALAAKDFTAKRKEIASTMNLAGNLEKARAARKANIEAKTAAGAKAKPAAAKKAGKTKK